MTLEESIMTSIKDSDLTAMEKNAWLVRLQLEGANETLLDSFASFLENRVMQDAIAIGIDDSDSEAYQDYVKGTLAQIDDTERIASSEAKKLQKEGDEIVEDTMKKIDDDQIAQIRASLTK